MRGLYASVCNATHPCVVGGHLDSGTSPNKYMVLLRFCSQDAADEFYTSFNRRPFSALEACLLASLLTVILYDSTFPTCPKACQSNLGFVRMVQSRPVVACNVSLPPSAAQLDICHVVFVSKVEAANSRDMDIKLRSGITELPPCAVCLGIVAHTILLE